MLAGTTTSNASGQYRFDNLSAATYFVRQAAVPGRLQRPGQNVQQAVVSATDVAGQVGLAFDSFDSTTQLAEASLLNGKTQDASAKTAPEAIGGERDMFVTRTSAGGSVAMLANGNAPGVLAFEDQSGSDGRQVVTWDGADNDAAVLNPTGLGNLDLTCAGRDVGIRLLVGADHDGGSATLRVYSGAGNFSTQSFTILNTGDGSPRDTVVVLFSNFTVAGGTGADFTRVGAVELDINVLPASNGQIDQLGTVGPTVKAANFANLQPLTLGDRVWRDANNNAQLDAGESGIANVSVRLYRDDDGSNTLGSGDPLLATTTTDATGRYQFTGLLPASYLVQVDPANFSGSGPLVGLVSSTGTQPTPDPDNDVNGDDNGDPVTGLGVVAQAITLSAGGEPTTDGDTDPQTNLTLDFGFAPIADLLVLKTDNPDPVVAGQDLTYTLSVTNNGPSPATNVVVTDPLPAGVSFVSTTSSQGTSIPRGGHGNGRPGNAGQRRDRQRHDRGARAAVDHRHAAEHRHRDGRRAGPRPGEQRGSGADHRDPPRRPGRGQVGQSGPGDSRSGVDATR